MTRYVKDGRIIVSFGPPPRGYVPGVGRGATGFITSVNLGSIADEELTPQQKLEEKEWEMIDSRRKRQPKKQPTHITSQTKTTIKTQYQAPNTSRNSLSSLSENDWLSIPDSINSGHRRIRSRRDRQEFSFISSESILQDSFRKTSDSAMLTSIDPLVAASLAKESHLTSQLEKVSSKYTETHKSVDAEQVLTSLANTRVLTESDVADVSRTELLFNAMIKANPTNPTAYITLSRTKAIAGKLSQARQLLSDGILRCPPDESLYLEAVHLETTTEAKSLILEAALENESLKTSIQLWEEYMDLMEPSSKEFFGKIAIALEINPEAESIWKLAISNCKIDPAAAQFFKSATTNCPKSLDLWTGYIQLMIRKPNPDASHARRLKKIFTHASKHHKHSFTLLVLQLQSQEMESTRNNMPPLDILKSLTELVERIVPKIEESEFTTTSGSSPVKSPFTGIWRRAIQNCEVGWNFLTKSSFEDSGTPGSLKFPFSALSLLHRFISISDSSIKTNFYLNTTDSSKFSLFLQFANGSKPTLPPDAGLVKFAFSIASFSPHTASVLFSLLLQFPQVSFDFSNIKTESGPQTMTQESIMKIIVSAVELFIQNGKPKIAHDTIKKYFPGSRGSGITSPPPPEMWIFYIKFLIAQNLDNPFKVCQTAISYHKRNYNLWELIYKMSKEKEDSLALESESITKAKSSIKIATKGVTMCPKSTILWTALINDCENERQRKTMIERAKSSGAAIE